MTSTTSRKSRMSPPIGVWRTVTIRGLLALAVFRVKPAGHRDPCGHMDILGPRKFGWSRRRQLRVHAMRLLGRCLVVATVASSSIWLAPACVQNDQSIYIRVALAPPTNRQNNVCLYQPDPTAPFLPEGVLDTAVRDSYTAA